LKSWLAFSVMICLILPSITQAAIVPVLTDTGLVAGDKTVGTAVRYMRIGMWHEAESNLRRILGYRPENHAAQFNLGVCLENQGQVTLAKSFYKKAIQIRPEPLYCEALARLDSVSGKGAEFLKFMIPCLHRCDHGYAFAHAGLWQEANVRFTRALNDSPDPVTYLNCAVASEVLGQRAKAKRYLSRATTLSGRAEYDQFSLYLATAPDFSLDLLLKLPALSTITDARVLTSGYVRTKNAAIRMGPDFGSPVISLQVLNSKMDILENTKSWFRVRTIDQKEGFIPAVFLSYEPVPPGTANSYSTPYLPVTTPTEKTDEEITPAQPVTSVVIVKKSGNSVVVRKETSLLAEIAGYVDPGKKLRVKNSANPKWYEITKGNIRGYILKSYVETPESESAESVN